MSKKIKKTKPSDSDIVKAYELMSTAKAMTELYEENFKVVSKYVHATSRGHEAIQIALGMQLKPQDYLSAYYRDDALLLSIGLTPFDLMLQLFAKKDDPFSGGRSYYCHPSLNDSDKPKIPHQSSATGMQAIPTVGIAMGLRYKHQVGISDNDNGIVVCSIGDASMTEGEVAEALQTMSHKQLPCLFVVQDNDWDISAYKSDYRSSDAGDYGLGFPGIEVRRVRGNNFIDCFLEINNIIKVMRKERRPFLLHAPVPLLNHHTSGVRMEWYRDDLKSHKKRDPFPILKDYILTKSLCSRKDLNKIDSEVIKKVNEDFVKAQNSPDPSPIDLYTHDFQATPIIRESGERSPKNGEEKVMVDCALFAIKELMEDHKECLLYGQDVGRRLGGVFREAATLAETFGDNRVFNTAIQEAFIIGSTVGMSAVGLRPIVEVQFADYMWPGINQLFTEVSRSCYLSNGKYPVSCIIRVPIGAYGNGGPYHSSSIESVLCNIKGIKIAYPSNGADLKGLIKAAYYDPNPCLILEHKGLYWSKVPGTGSAKRIEPAKNYILPFGKAIMTLECDEDLRKEGEAILIVAYGMGVHWALQAAKEFPKSISILDLRTLYPLDEQLIIEQARLHHRILVITEEPESNSFAQSIAARIQQNCFETLDAPVMVIGSKNLPAIPLNETLEKEMLPSSEKVAQAINILFDY